MIIFEGDPNGVRLRVISGDLKIHDELLSPERAFQLFRELQNALFVWNELGGGGQKIDKENPV